MLFQVPGLLAENSARVQMFNFVLFLLSLTLSKLFFFLEFPFEVFYFLKNYKVANFFKKEI